MLDFHVMLSFEAVSTIKLRKPPESRTPMQQMITNVKDILSYIQATGIRWLVENRISSLGHSRSRNQPLEIVKNTAEQQVGPN